MKIHFTTVFILFFVLLFFASCSSPDNSIPVESFFNKDSQTSFQLSPNGKYISYLKKFNGVQNLFVIDIEKGKTERITSETDIGIRSSFWASDDELIILKVRSYGDSLRLMAVNRNDRKVRYLIPPFIAKMRWLGPKKLNSNHELLIGLNDRDSSVFDAYRLNIINGDLDLVDINPGNIVRWIPDIEGKIKMAIKSDGHTETIVYRKNEEDDFRTIIENNFRTSIEPLGFSSRNEDQIFALSNQNRDKKELVEINILTGKEEVLFSHDEVDVAQGGYCFSRGAMNFAIFNTWKEEYHFFNQDMESFYQKIKERLPGYIIHFEDHSDDYSKFLVRAYTDVEAGSYYYYDATKDRLKEVGKVNSVLKGSDLSPTKSIHYTTSDGTVIYGYLTVPAQLKASKLPLIVIPHNGPTGRIVWGYDAEVQFLVSRGFAVFQPNYRGSTGYGKEFWTAGFKQWGLKVQDDIREGVEWLVQEGIADPKRVGIYGYNFGGYAALHAACFSTKVYACAASYSGITNLYTYLKEFPSYYTPYMKKYYEMVGNPEKDGNYLKAHSPIFHISNIQIPLFIAQGGRDHRNNVNETNHFVKELQRSGVKVTYMLKDEEKNYFVNEKNNVDFYRTLEEFFTQNLLK